MQNSFLNSELTKGSSFILAFSFLALFSFQDAVGAAFKVFASSGDLFIIPHFRKFVKSFFQSFSSSFGVPSSCFAVSFRSFLCISRSAHKLFNYTTFSDVCQEVFRSFLRFLSSSFLNSWLFSSSSKTLRLPSGLAANLFIIPHL